MENERHGIISYVVSLSPIAKEGLNGVKKRS